MSSSMEAESVELLVRNPSASFSTDLKLRVPATASIQALKELLREKYEGNPPPATQKLIISGQIVKDNQLLRDVLKHANLAEPQVVHLVLAPSKSDAPSSSAQSPLRPQAANPQPALGPFSIPPQRPPPPTPESVRSASNEHSPPPSQTPPPASQPSTSTQRTQVPQAEVPQQGGAGPSSSGQGAGIPQGPLNGTAGLSQEALQQLYLQLLQSNPFLTPLACNLAALSMGLQPPQANQNAAIPLGALYPGFNFAVPRAQDHAAPEQQRAAPAQEGGGFLGVVQNAARMAGQPIGGLAQNRPFAFQMPNQGGQVQGAQIHFMHPGAMPPQGFPQDAAAQAAGLRHRNVQNGDPNQLMGQFGIPQGVPIVVRVRRIQIDFMLIAKLAVIVFVLNQDGSIERLVLLTFLAVLAYLYQTGVLAPYIRLATERVQRFLQQQGRPQQGAAGGANQQAPANGGNVQIPAAGGALAGAVQRQRAGGGFLREIQLFVMGFITSLLPGFQPPEALPEPGPVAPQPQGGQAGVNDRPHND